MSTILYIVKTIEANERIRIEMILRSRDYTVEWLERKNATDQI
jgi:hypothetical protein